MSNPRVNRDSSPAKSTPVITTKPGAHENDASNQASLPRPSLAELRAVGRRLRDKCPRQSHADWKPPTNRPDPVALVKQSDKGRIPKLVPVRHGRMLQTPFTFYRGAALNMAADLASTPATGLRGRLAAIATFSTSARSPLQRDDSFSTSMIWMKRSPHPGNGT